MSIPLYAYDSGADFSYLIEHSPSEGIDFHLGSGEPSIEELNQYSLFMYAGHKVPTLETREEVWPQYFANGGKAIFTLHLRNYEDAEAKREALRPFIGCNLFFASVHPYFDISLERTLTLNFLNGGSTPRMELGIPLKNLQRSSSHSDWFPVKINFQKENQASPDVIIGDMEREDGFEYFDDMEPNAEPFLKRKITSKKINLLESSLSELAFLPFVPENYLTEKSYEDLRNAYNNFVQTQITGVVNNGTVTIAGRPFEGEYASLNFPFFKQLVLKYLSVGATRRIPEPATITNELQAARQVPVRKLREPIIPEDFYSESN